MAQIFHRSFNTIAKASVPAIALLLTAAAGAAADTPGFKDTEYAAKAETVRKRAPAGFTVVIEKPFGHDLDSAVAQARGKMTLMGNINNPSLLLYGTPQQVAQACTQAVQAGVHILAPECTVPLATPTANLQALVDVAKGMHS